MKLAFFYEADTFWVDWSTVSANTVAPTIGKLYPVSFFGSAEMGKLGRFIFKLYKDD